ncbi:MAG TPA: tRNA pseudouridine(13) synthase TruD, partial [Gammaproteobacteria bacterium]|nr:tRNA pseudouridine(13) synthase TruD [Gammaproteobacteria bacterium]
MSVQPTMEGKSGAHADATDITDSCAALDNPAPPPGEKPVLALPFAFGGPCCRAILRLEPEDFQVDEVTLVEPDGKGEHVLLWIEKRNANTDWLAGQL